MTSGAGRGDSEAMLQAESKPQKQSRTPLYSDIGSGEEEVCTRRDSSWFTTLFQYQEDGTGGS